MMANILTYVWLALCFFVVGSYCFASGIRLKEWSSVCVDQRPNHFASAGTLAESRPLTESPYRISINETEFSQNTVIKISVTGTVPFRGFLIQVRPIREHPDKVLPPPTGQFISAQDGVGFRCNSNSVNTVSHREGSAKTSTWVLWKPPVQWKTLKPLVASVTLVESYDRIWIGLQSNLMKKKELQNVNTGRNQGLQIVDTPIVTKDNEKQEETVKKEDAGGIKSPFNPLSLLFGGGLGGGGGGSSNLLLQLLGMGGGFGTNPLLQILGNRARTSSTSADNSSDNTESSNSGSSSLSSLIDLLSRLSQMRRNTMRPQMPNNPFGFNPFNPNRRIFQPGLRQTFPPMRPNPLQLPGALSQAAGGGAQAASNGLPASLQ